MVDVVPITLRSPFIVKVDPSNVKFSCATDLYEVPSDTNNRPVPSFEIVS